MMYTEPEVRELLLAHDIPLDTWGTGTAKTFDHLMYELRAQESRLEMIDDVLVRVAEGSAIYVYYEDAGRPLILREDRQVYKDGRVRRRADIDTSVAEKRLPGEDPLETAYRALREELAIAERLPLVWQRKYDKGVVPSDSFPGMMSQYLVNLFELFLPERHYRPEGYVEHQADKSSYFIWKEKVA